MSDLINTAQLINNRVYINSTNGDIQFGVNDEDITPQLLELLKLMPGSVITELIVDDDNKFFRLAFKNDELKIDKFIEFTFDQLLN